jgi:hypothetical protein
MHTAKQLRFQISQLRQDKVIYAVESIAVFIFSLFTSAFLPNLLMQYVFTDPKLTELPAVVQYTPVVAFFVGVAYFLYAMFGNLGRLSKIKKLEAELADVVLTDGECCGECDHHHDEMSSSHSVGLMAEKMKATKTRRAAKR